MFLFSQTSSSHDAKENANANVHWPPILPTFSEYREALDAAVQQHPEFGGWLRKYRNVNHLTFDLVRFPMTREEVSRAILCRDYTNLLGDADNLRILAPQASTVTVPASPQHDVLQELRTRPPELTMFRVTAYELDGRMKGAHGDFRATAETTDSMSVDDMKLRYVKWATERRLACHAKRYLAQLHLDHNEERYTNAKKQDEERVRAFSEASASWQRAQRNGYQRYHPQPQWPQVDSATIEKELLIIIAAQCEQCADEFGEE